MSPSRLLPLLLPPPATRALRAARRLVDWSRTEPTTPRASFSQCGEDLIIAFYCRSAGLGVPDYLDVGAFDPWHISNTALFYLQGARGLVIEPNPDRAAPYVRARPRDAFANVGVAETAGTLTYHRFDAETLNTFDAAEAERLQREEGHRLVSRVQVPVDTLPNLLARHWTGPIPALLSLDVEGVATVPLLESLGPPSAWPRVLCLETVSYSRKGRGTKDAALIDHLRGRGYRAYADTWINTVFVRDDRT